MWFEPHCLLFLIYTAHYFRSNSEKLISLTIFIDLFKYSLFQARSLYVLDSVFSSESDFNIGAPVETDVKKE